MPSVPQTGSPYPCGVHILGQDESLAAEISEIKRHL